MRKHVYHCPENILRPSVSDIPYLFKKHGVNLSEVMQISVSKTDKDSVFVAQPAPWIISGE